MSIYLSSLHSRYTSTTISEHQMIIKTIWRTDNNLLAVVATIHRTKEVTEAYIRFILFPICCCVWPLTSCIFKEKQTQKNLNIKAYLDSCDFLNDYVMI